MLKSTKQSSENAYFPILLHISLHLSVSNRRREAPNWNVKSLVQVSAVLDLGVTWQDDDGDDGRQNDKDRKDVERLLVEKVRKLGNPPWQCSNDFSFRLAFLITHDDCFLSLYVYVCQTLVI